MSDSTTLEDLYPIACAFCKIADAFPLTPFPSASISASGTSSSSSSSSKTTDIDTLQSYIPTTVDADTCSPACHLVLNSPAVMAFLDIMPMTSGHLLVTSRSHHVKIEDVPTTEAQDLGFWLPILAKAVMKAIDCTDYNLVQNNGPRAAQVVPHVHVHIIPRPSSVPQIQHRSWTMFGKGAREDLDDEEAAKLSEEIRDQVRNEIARRFTKESKI